jgi:hypothetical protein
MAGGLFSSAFPYAKPLEEFIKAEDDANYTAIGKFIVAYASAENSVHLLARKLTGLNDDKARLLFGGARIGEVVTKTRALLRAAKRAEATKNIIESCLDHFDAIGGQRDKLVHRSTQHSTGKIRVTNILTAKSLLHSENHDLTLVDLRNMTMDCYSISLRFMQIYSPKKKKEPIDRIIWDLRDPWQYKSVRPDTAPKQNRQNRKSRRRQPPA